MMLQRDLPWRVEETCFNAFPSLKQVLLGDWLCRFSKGVSRRANSINPLGPDPAGITEAITVGERLYVAQGQPTIFRVPTIVAPALDRELAARGYTAEGETCVVFGAIDAVAAAYDPAVSLLSSPEPAWLAGMIALQGYDEAQSATYGRMVGAIGVDARFASLTIDGAPVNGAPVNGAPVNGAPVNGAPAALAYGVLHDGLLCYESVITDPSHRRGGLGRRVIASLAAWARDCGASGACLQVQADNTPARTLYTGFGLTTELHRYHYRRAPAER